MGKYDKRLDEDQEKLLAYKYQDMIFGGKRAEKFEKKIQEEKINYKKHFIILGSMIILALFLDYYAKNILNKKNVEATEKIEDDKKTEKVEENQKNVNSTIYGHGEVISIIYKNKYSSKITIKEIYPNKNIIYTKIDNNTVEKSKNKKYVKFYCNKGYEECFVYGFKN